MPTIIGHTAAALALTRTFPFRKNFLWGGLLCIFCSTIPDADVVAFRLGIPYHHWLGHRGISHSLIFAGVAALAAYFIMPKKEEAAPTRFLYFAAFFACGLIHDLLDAMTNGGLGVALFYPFSQKRLFLPWQPIEVSPLNPQKFLSEGGMQVLASEMKWIIIPAACIFLFSMWLKKNRKEKSRPLIKSS